MPEATPVVSQPTAKMPESTPEMSDSTPEPQRDSNLVRRTLKNAGMLVFGTVMRMSISFVFVVFAADRLGVQGFGIYSIGVHYFELFLSLAATPIATLLTREIAKSHDDSTFVNRYAATGLTFGLILAIAGIFCMVALSWLFGFSDTACRVVFLAAIALVPAALANVIEAIFIAHERAEFVALAVSVEGVLRTSLGILAVLTGYGLEVLFMILIGTRVLQLLLFWCCMRISIQVKPDYSALNLIQFFKDWKTFAAETWMATISISLDMTLLSWLSTEASVGIYNAAWKLVTLGSLAARSYTLAVFPMLSRMYQDSQSQFRKAILKTIRLMGVIAIPAIIVTTLFAEELLGVIFDTTKYADAVPVLQVLTWVLLLEFLNPFLSYSLFAQGRQDRSLQVACLSLVINCTITLALISQFDAVGAAIGTVIAGLASTTAYLCFSMGHGVIRNILGCFARTLVASLIVGAMLFVMQDANLFLLIASGCLAYGVLILLMKLVHTEDIQLLRSIVSSRSAT